ncbi:putative polyketide synthase [Hypoxylon sp. FL1150]|nr:putative polyketide synthase [Hypoxylon sp. FL1150]
MTPHSRSSPTEAHSETAPDSVGSHTPCDIAIIGFSFQFPRSDSAESFWNVLISGKCVTSEFPPDRLCSTRYHGAGSDRTGTVSYDLALHCSLASPYSAICTQKASFLQRDIGAFDARFFGMTPEEAMGTDPQQRILLETTYRALENAGIPLDTIDGSDTSVHTGCFTADYSLTIAKDPEYLPKYAATGAAGSMLSNRISTFFGLTGPSITVDTACSSSLVALDLACQAIKDGRSKMGIVAGCNLLLTSDLFISLSNLGFLSPDGACHSFDTRANGYGRGEGFGVLIIKALDDAVRDGDTIRTVVRATGTNQNGHTSLAQPSKEMQRQLIESTYRNANLTMSQTGYFEAHGTGTAIGDPLEAMAIGDAFRSKRDPDDPLIIGAVKANIGHLEGAAGIAGIIKAILVLEKGIIPPIAKLSEVNEDIDSDFLNLEFPKTPIPWPRPGLRRASVNSFGFGGTNAHAVLDDAFHYLQARGLTGNHCTETRLPNTPTPEPQPAAPNNTITNGVVPHSKTRLFIWSARERKTTTLMTNIHLDYLEERLANNSISQDDLNALAHTLAYKRSLHSWRTFAVADSVPHLKEQLKVAKTPILSKPNRKTAFVFTGQGAQWAGMGRELFSYPVFRECITEADKFLHTIGCSWKATDILQSSDGDGVNINEPKFAQPLCTIIQVAIVELLRSFGVHATVSVGHSSGEIAAAYTTGAISRESAWKLAYFRGLVSSELAESSVDGPQGTMMAVGASASLLLPYIEEILASSPGGVLSVACLNSPNSTTLAGDIALIQSIYAKLGQDGIFTRILKVPVAYHSAHMTSIASTYKRLIGALSSGKPPPHRVNMISSVTGDMASTTQLQAPYYWVANMVSPVRFSEAVERLYRDSSKETTKKLDMSHQNYIKITDIVEIGPHSALQGPIREISKSSALSNVQISYTPALVRGRPATSTILELVGNLYCHGHNINLASVNNSITTPNVSYRSLGALPEYPFDHSKSYWSEPRIAKNMRLLSSPYNQFLGLPVADWNPLEPHWRNTLKTSSIEWLEDHQINGKILYPAAAMLVMAIEGITQVDVQFRSALVVPSKDTGVTVQFHLKPSLDSSEKSGSWASFSLFICDDEFIEVCRGSVKTISSLHESVEDDENSVRLSGGTETQSEDFYATLRKNGYQYGPTFQGVQRSMYNTSGKGITSTAQDFSAIHPCTLDNILQLVVSGDARKADDAQMATWIPSYITRLWVSSSGFKSRERDDSVQVHIARHNMGARMRTSTVRAVHEGESKWLFEAEGIETTLIAEDTPSHAMSQVRKLCYDLILKPDLDLVDAKSALRYTQERARIEPRASGYLDELRLFMLAASSRVVSSMSRLTIPITKPHLQRQYDWMRQIVDSAKEQPSSSIPPNWMDFTKDSSFENLGNRLRTYGPLGELYVKFSSHVRDIFQGTVNATEILDPNHVIKEYYEMIAKDTQFQSPLNRYIDSLAHKNPSMRILEVGTGNGLLTESVMNILTRDTSTGPFCRFSHYDITAPSTSGGDAITKQVGPLPKTKVGVLDVNEEPVAQGYEEYSYDVILAVNMVESAESPQRSLGNLRRLLRNDGKLIVVDFTNPDSMVGRSILGYFPEWWQGQPPTTPGYEETGPSITYDRWSHELEGSGFVAPQLVFHDFESGENQLSTVIVSAASNAPQQWECIQNWPVLIVSGFDKSSKSPLATLVFSKLKALGFTDVCDSNMNEAAAQSDYASTLVVIVQDLNWLVLECLDTEQYAVFHTTVNRYKYIMWLSEITPSSGEVPSIDAAQGLARTLRMENQGHIFSTFGLDTSRPACLSANLQVSLSNFFQGVLSGPHEPELIQVGDLLHIPRTYECDMLNTKINALSSDYIEGPQRFGDRNMQLKVSQPGLLDTLYFEEIPEYGPLADDEIEIDVKSAGVNFKDCLVALGRVAEDTIGCECAGVVVRVGSACHLQPGDRVLVCALDTFRGRLRCLEMLAAKIPDGMTFAEAGGLTTNFVTAHYSLIIAARLAPGESVLIHSGAGGTGQAAIQIAKMRGAQVFTTVGSSKKRKLLHELYEIPMDHIFNSRDLSFARGIKRLTQNKGVDVVLNSLAGDALIASWECVAPFGRFVEIGKKDIFSHNKLPMFQFARNISFSAVDIGAMISERPELIRDSLRCIADLFERGVLRAPSPLTSFSISQVQSAFRHLQSGNNSGKVVVEIDPEDTVLAKVKRRSNWQFGPYETFVIAGGLGGQGRSISKWMVSKGARNLVLLSRTGPKDSGTIAFIEGLREKGVVVYTPACNISDAASLAATVEYCKLNMPPIKGCIQAAMDIRDSVFENMSHESWIASLKPKIAGSWNLHQQLPRDLDFFILFASVSGIIGSQGQSNYAVGNTYQDGLAKYRLSRGEKAISLDLGILTGDGYLAQNQDALMRFVKIKQMLPIAEHEVLALLEHFCDKSLPLDPSQSQIIVGLDLPADIINRGMEPSSWTHEPMFSNLQQMTSSVTDGANNATSSGPTLASQVLASTSLSEATEILARGLAERLTTIFSMSQDGFDLNQPLHTYGVDSLIAVELRNWFLKTLKVDLAIFEISGGATAVTLGRTAAEKMRSWE